MITQRWILFTILIVLFLFFVFSHYFLYPDAGREGFPQHFSEREISLDRFISTNDALHDNIQSKDIETVCVIIRTHERQVYDEVYPLSALLNYFTTIRDDIDIAINLLPTDAIEPIGIRLLYEYYKFRINISLIEYQNLPSPYLPGYFGVFRDRHNPNFHNLVYSMTDDAISNCPDNFQWLLVTNGDNTYMPTFFDHLDNRYDIVAFDFYTRHYYYNSGFPIDMKNVDESCRRLLGNSYLESSCLSNNLSFAHTDLGANVLNLKKYRKEHKMYGNIIEDDRGVSKDGYMISDLVKSGWTVKHVRKQHDIGCLYSHNPNYQSCINHSFYSVWDGSNENCILPHIPRNLDNFEEYILERCVPTKL